jgi:alanine racemase
MGVPLLGISYNLFVAKTAEPVHLKWIEIDLGAIRSNIRWTLSKLKRQTRLMAVLKADAYGHGMVPVAREAEKSGASSLGVLTIAEARVLRQAGVRMPIHVLAPISPFQVVEAVKLDLTITADHLDQLRALNAVASLLRPIPVHIDLDFGLGRWGISPRHVDSFFQEIARFKKINFEGLSTHIDYIPGKNAVEAEEKLRDFNEIGSRLKIRYPNLVCHAANSSVFMDFPHWRMDLARVGNLLYGINAPQSKSAPLKNPWKFKARIVNIRIVAAGESIGYASEYVAPRKMRVATLLAGYADGLTMESAERLIRLGSGFEYWGMLGKIKTPFVGRCGISHVLVDVTAVPRVKIGDTVLLPIRRTAASAQISRVYI